jgi:hypothetical protein
MSSTHLHLVPKLRTNGALHPHPHTSSWHITSAWRQLHLTYPNSYAVSFQHLYKVILNCCRGFRVLLFSYRNQQNKTAYGIWKWKSESFITHRCTRRIDVWEKYDVIFQNGNCPRESNVRYFGFLKRSPLSKRNFVTKLNMERIHLQIMLSDVGWSSFKRLVVLCTEKEREDRALTQEDVDRIQEAWTSYVPRKARMLKLFSILQYWFYR